MGALIRAARSPRLSLAKVHLLHVERIRVRVLGDLEASTHSYLQSRELRHLAGSVALSLPGRVGAGRETKPSLKT